MRRTVHVLLLLLPGGDGAFKTGTPAPRARAIPHVPAARAPGIARAAPRPLHVRIDGKWYDATAWAKKHPGGALCLEWVSGFDVSAIFHTIHLFSRHKASAALSALPEVEEEALPTLEHERWPTPPERPLVFPDIRRVPLLLQGRIFEDDVLGRVTPPRASGPPEPFTRAAASERRTVLMDPSADSRLKAELEAMLHRHFRTPAEYKADAEHWARICVGVACVLWCLVGWARAEVVPTLLLPWAQWLLFSPAVHESSHHTLSTDPRVNHAAMWLGMCASNSQPEIVRSRERARCDSAWVRSLIRWRERRVTRGRPRACAGHSS